MRSLLAPLAAALLAAALLAAAASASGPVSLVLRPHGGSGITGTVVLTPLSAGRTRVAVRLSVHDGKTRPVHIHGGSCGTFFGLPFGAWDLHGARGSTVVHASLARLLGGGYALDLHAAPGAPAWVACVDLTR